MNINIHIKEDFRNFKSGRDYNINVPDNGILYLGGTNECGKSTLLQILRSNKDSLYDINKKLFDRMVDFRIENSKSLPVDISGYDYDETFFLDSIIDDPCSFVMSASASGFIDGGGFLAQRQSKGEKTLVMIAKFEEKIKKYLINKYGSIEEWKNSGKKALVVFDEADEGLDMRMQFNFNKFLHNVYNKKYNMDVIVVSHNPIVILSKTDGEIKVYDIEYNLDTDPSEYIYLLSGNTVDITYGDSNGRYKTEKNN